MEHSRSLAFRWQAQLAAVGLKASAERQEAAAERAASEARLQA